MTFPRVRMLLLTASFAGLLVGVRPTGVAPGAGSEQDEPASVRPSASVNAVRPAARPTLAAWHQAGQRGKGVKVAILDSGWRGYREHLGAALPTKVTAKSFRRDGNLEARDSQHGILCAEAVHTLAPDAELLLANWEPDSPTKFLEAVRWAKAEGATVLSCSVIMPCWSDGEGGGPVHAALADLLGDGTKAGDLLFFSCAGNIAQRHWSGPFADNGAGTHQWRADRLDNVITAWEDESLSVELCWPGAGKFRLQLFDAAGKLVSQAEAQADAGHKCAVVRHQPTPRGQYRVRVTRLDAAAKGAKAEPFHLIVLGGSLEHNTARGSIPFPGDGKTVVTVGAIDGDGRRAAYSSCGPNSVCPKPDFVATVPFQSAWRARPFGGTSAAAPQAAGVAAVLWGKHVDWSAGKMRTTLQASAQDLLSPGHDFETGFGLIRLPVE